MVWQNLGTIQLTYDWQKLPESFMSESSFRFVWSPGKTWQEYWDEVGGFRALVIGRIRHPIPPHDREMVEPSFTLYPKETAETRELVAPPAFLSHNLFVRVLEFKFLLPRKLYKYDKTTWLDLTQPMGLTVETLG